MKFVQHDRVKRNGQKAKVLTGWQTLGGEATYKIEMLEGPFVGMVFDAKESSLSPAEYEPDLMEVNAFGSSFKINVEKSAQGATKTGTFPSLIKKCGTTA